MTENHTRCRLLISDNSDNDTEALISLLREAGYQLSSQRIPSLEKLHQAISEQSWDLFIAHPQGRDLPIDAVLTLFARKQIDIPVLLLSTTESDTSLLPLLQAGARASIRMGQQQQLLFIIQRELKALQERRQCRSREKQYVELERRYLELIDNSRDAIAYLHEGMHILANPAYLDFFGYEHFHEMEGVSLLDIIAPQDHEQAKSILRQFSKGEPIEQRLEIHTRDIQDRISSTVMEISPAIYSSEACIRIIIRSREEGDQALQKKLLLIKNQDILTNLFNGQYFLRKLKSVYKQVCEKKLLSTMFYIELDNIDEIRNKLGVAAGDVVIIDIATLLRKKLNASNALSRFDGHVFTAIIEDTDAASVKPFADSLCKLIAQHKTDFEHQIISTTCSIGISLISANIPSVETILDRAYKAARQAQEDGGNRTSIYIPMEDELADEEKLAQWKLRIEDALKTDRWQLLYQPIVSLRGDSGEQYSVLLRMEDKDGTIIMPRQFIPAAQRNGLMSLLDRHVIQKAILHLSEPEQRSRKTILFIKLSEDAIADLTLIPWLKKQIEKQAIEAKQLIFEISQPIALQNMKQVLAITMGMRKLHCRIALDHFTGDENAYRIQNQLKAEFVKIDGSIIGRIAHDDEAMQKLDEINHYVHEASGVTIAQFVEDATSLAQLWESGINYIQGYFVQEPNAKMLYEFPKDGREKK